MRIIKIIPIALTIFISLQALTFEKPDQLALLETEVTIAKMYRDHVDATSGTQILFKKEQELVEYSNFIRDSAAMQLSKIGRVDGQNLKSELDALSNFALETGQKLRERNARIRRSVDALVEFNKNGDTSLLQKYVETYMQPVN